MKPYAERLYNGIVKENPVFVLMLGMCPTLAITTSGMNGIEDRVTSLLTWGLPLGALAFCASLVLAWFGAPDGFWRGFWEGAAAVLVVAGLAARLWRSFRTRGK